MTDHEWCDKAMLDFECACGCHAQPGGYLATAWRGRASDLSGGSPATLLDGVGELVGRQLLAGRAAQVRST